MENKIRILKYIHYFKCRGYEMQKCHSINDDINDLILYEELYKKQEKYKLKMDYINKNMPDELFYNENQNIDNILDDIIKMVIYGIKIISESQIT